MTTGSTSDWQARADQLDFDTRAVVGGERVTPSGDRGFRTVNPATGEHLAEFADADAAAVDIAVAAAKNARAAWRTLAPARRKEVLLALADALRARAADFAILDTLEMGKPISEALGEVAGAADFLQYYAEMADKIGGEIACSSTERGLSMTYLEPRGIVGVITPWNFPLFTALSAIAPALAAGNCVVQKPSEYSPSSALRLADLAGEVGLPPGVLNVVPGTGVVTGAALARHMQVGKLHFTGSTAVGKQLMIYAGESNGKPVMLETGGKSPQVVFADAIDIDGLGAALAAEVYANSGQVCVARTRLIVHEAVAETVVERIVSEAQDVFTIGNTLDPAVNFGPVSSAKQFDRVSAYIRGAQDDGAELREAKIAGVQPDRGYYASPVVATAVKPTMRIVREEVFGPVLSVLAFSDDDEAIALANDTSYGLAATVWTRDLRRARRLSHAIDAGRVDIRCAPVAGASLAHLSAEPFGASGHGVLGGRKGLDPYLRHKGVQFLTG